jgi:hypothetical protein
MKTRQLAFLTAAGVLFGAAGLSQAENAMYSCTRADGTTSLTNVPVGTQCEQLFTYKPPVEAAPAPVASAPAAPGPAMAPGPAQQPAAAPAVADRKAPSPADPAANPAGARSTLAMRMAQRRDAARLAVADAYARGQPASVANPATSRRYLMTNRADYIQANGFSPQ